MDIDQLILQAKEGEIQSFEILYKEFRDMILNYIIRVGISPEDAEEICDDVFLHVYQNFQVFVCHPGDER